MGFLHGTLAPTCLVLATLLAVAACSGPAPYLHKPQEHNRNSKDFGKPATDIAEAAICYNRFSTSPDEIRALARDACGQFGKVPRLRGQDHLTCPLLVPSRAIFDCVPPSGS